MAQEFLNAAEEILRLHQKPLLIKDILQKALENQLLTTAGKTPINTLRARLSEHIAEHKSESKFIRVSPNHIALRGWPYEEYQAKVFEKDKSREIIVCIDQDLVDKHKRPFGFSTRYELFLKDLEDLRNITLRHREEARNRDDIKQLVSYVLLKDNKNRILSFVRGSYGQKESLLQGVLCIGFGGHVNVSDLDLFGIKDAGVSNSARREINEEIKGLKINEFRYLGIINDDSSPLGLNHFAFVLEAQLPKTFNEKKSKREMSINKLELLDHIQLWQRFHELEFWSQLLVKKFVPKPKDFNPVFVKSKGKLRGNEPILIVGEIGSGKTEVSNYMSKKFKLPMISSRMCVAKLIKEVDFGIGNRKSFQEKAGKLVSTNKGISKLAHQIITEIKNANSNCVIVDGVRNLETYNILKQSYPNIILIYIDVPRATAFNLYIRRSGKKEETIHEFRNARDHPVEKEITLFKTRADIYIFNGGTLKDLYAAINQMWHAKRRA